MEAVKIDPRLQLMATVRQALEEKGWKISPDPESKTDYSYELVPLVPTTTKPVLKIYNPSHHKWREVREYHKQGEVEFTRLSITEMVIILWSPPVKGSVADQDQAVILADWASETLADVVSILPNKPSLR